MRTVALLGLVGLLAGVAVSSPSHAASAASSDALFTGVVEGADAGGSSVNLYLWPSEGELEQMQEGDTFEPRLIGSTEAAADGTFTLSADAGAASDLTSGTYDTSIVATGTAGSLSAADTSLSYNSTTGKFATIAKMYSGDDGGTTDPVKPYSANGNPGADKSISSITMDASGAPVVTLHLDPATNRTVSGPSEMKQASQSATSSVGVYATGLTTTLVTKYTNRLTHVGALHATTSGHSSSFKITSGATSSLGAAANTGSGWKVSGGVSRSIQATQRWAARTIQGSVTQSTRYSVGKYKNVLCEYGACATYYTLRPISHEGGAESYAMATPTANYCRNYEKGSGITLNRNSAVKYGTGLKVSSIVGFDVSATAGFSSSESLAVSITAAGKKICGTNRYPGEFPSHLVVKAR